jgi:two-component system sensor histidine kinase KdpD
MARTLGKNPVETGDDIRADERERERLHRQILSSVSHDLKTPLASIIGSLEVYERMDGRLSECQRQSLITVALQEAYRLDNFITNILDMAKLENGMVKLRRETVALGALLEDCITRLGHRLRESKVLIEAPTGPCELMTDPTLLARAVCLLLDNAVKYGGHPATIRIAFGQDDEGQRFICVMDNGAGVSEARLEDIFSKYTRLARGDQQNAGTGLGLAICRAIMRLLQGSVTAANDKEGGMIFTLHFPSL